MDIGCYPISLSRFIFDSEPERVFGIIDYCPTFKTDRLVSAIMDFGGRTATFTVATQVERHQRVQILGTKGRIEIEIPFNAPNDVPTRLWLEKEGIIEEFLFQTCDQYGIQGDVFSKTILKNDPIPTPLEDAVANMNVIDAIIASHLSNSWKTI